jgi:hypothetical protein
MEPDSDAPSAAIPSRIEPLSSPPEQALAPEPVSEPSTSPERRWWHVHRHANSDRVQALSALAIVAITALYTYYARKQVLASQDALATAREANSIAQASLRLEHRPYVLPSDITGGIAEGPTFNRAEPRPGVPYYVNIMFENFGRSPAIEFRPRLYIVYGADTARLDQVYSSLVPDTGGSVLTPSKTLLSTAVTLDKPPLVYPARTAAWNGAWPFYVCAVATYKSVWNEEFTTRFCRKLLPGTDGGLFMSVLGKEQMR